MTVLTLNNRKIGYDDISWGYGSFVYTDPYGVDKTMPQVNMNLIPGGLDIYYIRNEADLADALTAMGSNPGGLYFRRGTYTIDANTTLPSTARIWVENGAKFYAVNATLKVDGPITAGQWQIFSWTGTGAIDISDSPTTLAYFDWFGALAETGTPWTTYDNSNALAMAYSACATHQTIQVSNGIWRIATSTDVTGANFRYYPSLAGVTQVFYCPDNIRLAGHGVPAVFQDQPEC